MREYDAVIFDFDGPIATNGGTPYTDAMYDAARIALKQPPAKFSEPPEEFITAIQRKDLEDVREHAADHDIDAEAVWQMARRIDRDIQRIDFWSGKRSQQGGLEVLDDLDEHYDLAVLSNNQDPLVTELITEYWDLDDHFEYIEGLDPTTAGQQYRKPDPQKLIGMMDAMGSETVLYVGDSAVDIMVADRATAEDTVQTVDSVFYHADHRDETYLSERRVFPTYEIDHMTDLPDLLADPASFRYIPD